MTRLFDLDHDAAVADLLTAAEAVVAEREVPAVALACGVGGTVAASVVLGGGAGPHGAEPVRPDTLFDLASLTKVLGTATSVLALVDRGDLALDDRVSRWVPEFSDGDKARVTVRQLLTHTGGLLDTRRYYETHPDAAALRAAVVAEPLLAEPGTRVCYSDLGYILLGDLVARVTGEPFDAACRRLALAPLGLTRTTFRPDRSESIAATELAVAPVGVVHDRNAATLGGVSGHAGLFGPLSEVSRCAQWWSSGGPGPLSDELRREAMRCQTGDTEGRRGLGWTCRGDAYDFLGDGWSAQAVSHSGFTGTSIAVDPSLGWWAVLLTNAVHYGRDRTSLRLLRHRMHELVATALRSTARPTRRSTSGSAPGPARRGPGAHA